MLKFSNRYLQKYINSKEKFKKNNREKPRYLGHSVEYVQSINRPCVHDFELI